MEIRLDGHNVIVTGSAGLIGSELCARLAESGANLLLVDISERNRELGDSLRAKYPDSVIVDLDLNASQEQSAIELASIVDDVFGGTVHGLVNGLQYKSQSFFHDLSHTSEEELRDIFGANVFSVFWMAKHLTPHMKRARGASVVNLSSTYAIVSPNPVIYEGTNMGCPATYVATKGAVHSLTKYLACYLADDGIRVNSVTPHGVFNNHQERFVANFSALSPLHRMSKPEEVAPAIIFLLSDKSSYINGANIKIDGGWTAW